MNYEAADLAHFRGSVLKLVYTRHREQGSRLDNISLWALMRKLQFDVGQADVLFLLQDLKQRGYLDFSETKSKWTNKTDISRIEITAAGRDVFEEIRTDAAVLIA